MKLLKWIPANLLGILGIVQAGLKFLKEVLTLVVDILYPVIPSNKFHNIVDKVREVINIVDDWVEKLKNVFLGVID